MLKGDDAGDAAGDSGIFKEPCYSACFNDAVCWGLLVAEETEYGGMIMIRAARIARGYRKT
jgi:hypothetical protein